jgi:hypothetical protein
MAAMAAMLGEPGDPRVLRQRDDHHLIRSLCESNLKIRHTWFVKNVGSYLKKNTQSKRNQNGIRFGPNIQKKLGGFKVGLYQHG